MKNWVFGAVAAAALMNSVTVQAAEREPSSYLKCDGEPNNVTGGETFARFLGAITLLGLFAPSPETPDPEARLFGEEGVAACSALIDDPDEGEGNVVRRVPLILGRALHHIEAKNYVAALTDVELARDEATAGGLVGNPYFDRSMGLSFNSIEAAIHLRMGDPQKAREVSLSGMSSMRYSFVPNLNVGAFGSYLKDVSPAEEQQMRSEAQLFPAFWISYAGRLDEVGRFAEAAEAHEALIGIFAKDDDEENPPASWPFARAGVAHALAGNWEAAEKWATRAQTNMDDRIANGKPEDNTSTIVELLDFYGIVKKAHEGDLTIARRTFASRSKWTAPSFGSVLEVNRRLRAEAAEDELFGALEKSADELWQERYDNSLARALQKDTENDSLFDLIVTYAKIEDFERRAKNTHRVEKSKMLYDEPREDGRWLISTTGNLQSGYDAIVLHAALQAKHMGKEGFTMQLLTPRRIGYGGPLIPGFAYFSNSDEEGVSPLRFINADEVIAELMPVIPTRDEVKRRQKERRRNKRR